MNEEEKETTKEQSAAQALIENTEEIVDTAAEEEKAEPVSPVKEDADDENKIFRKYKNLIAAKGGPTSPSKPDDKPYPTPDPTPEPENPGGDSESPDEI